MGKLLNSYADLFKALDGTGVVILHDNTLADTLRGYLRDCPIDIPFMAEHGLSLVFFYDQTAQPEKWRHYMGMCFQVKHEEPPDEFCIGISSQRMAAGKDAVIETWLHEAAHVFHGSDVTAHDYRFHELHKALMEACKEGAEETRSKASLLDRLRAPMGGHRTQDDPR